MQSSPVRCEDVTLIDAGPKNLVHECGFQPSLLVKGALGLGHCVLAMTYVLPDDVTNRLTLKFWLAHIPNMF